MPKHFFMKISPTFPYESFISLDFTFNFMIHFQLTFLYGTRYEFSYVILHMDNQLFQHHLLKRLSFSHYLAFLCTFAKIQSSLCAWMYFCSLHSFLLNYLSIFSPTLHCLDFKSLEARYCKFSTLILFLKGSFVFT